MLSFLSIQNMLFKKSIINYSGYFALYLYFIFSEYKIILFIQKNQFTWSGLAFSLAALNLSNNYTQISSSVLKVLFKINANFIFRELILIFLNSEAPLLDLLSNDNFSNSIIFICYNNYFVNVNHLGFAKGLLNLFLSNYTNLKANSNFLIFCVAYYSHFIFKKILL